MWTLNNMLPKKVDKRRNQRGNQKIPETNKNENRTFKKKNQWDATKTSSNRVIYIDARPSLRRKISNKQHYLPTEWIRKKNFKSPKSSKERT